MTKQLETLYSYIQTHNTNSINDFVTYIGYHVIEKLPDRICSSKVIYDILRNDLDTYFKQTIFRETFMEYFKWRLLRKN